MGTPLENVIEKSRKDRPLIYLETIVRSLQEQRKQTHDIGHKKMDDIEPEMKAVYHSWVDIAESKLDEAVYALENVVTIIRKHSK